eukprot:7426699-Prorocentrum_lima.AAC.1
MHSNPYNQKELRYLTLNRAGYPMMKAAFATEQRMQQKAKHEAINLYVGEKHMPKTKPEDIEFGDD